MMLYNTRFRLHSKENVEIMDLDNLFQQETNGLHPIPLIHHFMTLSNGKFVTKPLLDDNKILIFDKYFLMMLHLKQLMVVNIYSWLKALHKYSQIPDIAFIFKVNRETILKHNESRKDLKKYFIKKKKTKKTY